RKPAPPVTITRVSRCIPPPLWREAGTSPEMVLAYCRPASHPSALRDVRLALVNWHLCGQDVSDLGLLSTQPNREFLFVLCGKTPIQSRTPRLAAKKYSLKFLYFVSATNTPAQSAGGAASRNAAMRVRYRSNSAMRPNLSSAARHKSIASNASSQSRLR